MHRGQRARQIDPDACRLARAHGPLDRQLLLERASLDELHPDPDLVAVDVGAVDRDHTLVRDLRQPPRLPQHPCPVERLRDRRPANQLERDIALQVCVPRTVDDTEGAAADLFLQLEMLPAAPHGARSDGAGHVRQDAQLADDFPLVVIVGALLRTVPVHIGAVGDGGREVDQRLRLSGLVMHGPSPRRAGQARGSRPSARRRPRACRTSRPARRR